MNIEISGAMPGKSELRLDRPSFDAGSEPLGDWLLGLRSAGVRHAAPALIIALENLRRADISASRRLAALRLFKTPVLKTCTGLPKPWASAAAGQKDRGVTLEQRLYRLMFQNLSQTLHQFDRCYFLLDARQTRRRNWVIRNLFRFFQRELRYAVLWGARLPENTWRDLHDLFVYLTVRGVPRTEGSPVAGAPLPGVDPEHEYKQLLLFGLAAQVTGSGVRSGALVEGLEKWASETVLEDPQGLDADSSLFVVEVSEDAPPREHRGHVNTGFRGWVLIPPPAFLEQLDRAAQGVG
ncbi:MAG: hypothetical protein WAM94_20370 [Chromatiaceae bacterium]